MARTQPSLDARTIIECLTRHEVSFVVIGAFAAEAHGARMPNLTSDVDVTPAADGRNLRRLSVALDEIGALLRVGDGDPVPFAHDAKSLVGFPFLNLTCPAGDFDLAFEPAAFETNAYERLMERATVMEIDGIRVAIADLMDVITSKLKADRPKDRLALPVLIQFAEAHGHDTSAIRLGPLEPPSAPTPHLGRPNPVADARRRLADLHPPDIAPPDYPSSGPGLSL